MASNIVSLLLRLREGETSTPVTTSDSAAQGPMRQLYVGTGGDIVGRLKNDTADRTFKNVPSGTMLQYSFILIKATGTTATDLVAVN